MVGIVGLICGCGGCYFPDLEKLAYGHRIFNRRTHCNCTLMVWILSQP